MYGEQRNQKHPDESFPVKTLRRGQNKRRQYSASFKADVIQEYEANVKAEDIAVQFNINRSLVLKWYKNCAVIMKAATSEHKKHLKIRPVRKYLDLYEVLLLKFKEAQGKGFRVDFNWLWSKARVLCREMTNNPDVIVRKHVIVNFIKRNRIRMSARQRNRTSSKEGLRDKLMGWHLNARERLVKTGNNSTYDAKVDQNPMPFAIDSKRAYRMYEPGENQNKTKVWISQPGSGLDKRQCTFQICFRPDGQLSKTGIISRGKGKRISQDVKDAWHPDANVFFQANAWADTYVCTEWIERTLKPVVKDLDRFVLFCDNLTAQVPDEFKKDVSKLNGVVWFGLPNRADLWQPVDAGMGELIKVLAKQEHHG